MKIISTTFKEKEKSYTRFIEVSDDPNECPKELSRQEALEKQKKLSLNIRVPSSRHSNNID